MSYRNAAPHILAIVTGACVGKFLGEGLFDYHYMMKHRERNEYSPELSRKADRQEETYLRSNDSGKSTETRLVYAGIKKRHESARN